MNIIVFKRIAINLETASITFIISAFKITNVHCAVFICDIELVVTL